MPKLKYTHIKSSITTISGLVGYSQFKAAGITVGSFVGTRDGSGITNLERIYERYTAADFNNDTDFLIKAAADVKLMKTLPEKVLATFVPEYDILKQGTELVIDSSDIHKGLPPIKASSNRPVSIEPFMNEVLKDLYLDDDFVDERALSDSKIGVYDRNPLATVWVWVKALGDGNHISGKLIDITPFLCNVSITKDKQSGQFGIGLSYVYDAFEGLSGSTYYDSVINSTDVNGIRRRNHSQFHALISKNDMVFIRLSRMKNEVGDTVPQSSDWVLDPNILNGKVFDMMGLVDNVKDNFGNGGSSVAVTINGQDFSKLLTNDGSSIYQNRYISSGSRSEEIELNGDIFRLWGKHTSLFQLQDQTIGKQLLFIIDYMTRSKICDNIFSTNPKARFLKLNIGEGNSFVSSDVSGIWQIVDVGVDKDIAGYTSFNSRIGNDYSNIMSQISQICQEPFVELYTDTYGDRFHIMARRPPFDYTAVKFWSESKTTRSINESDILSDSLDYDERAFSWYKMDIRFLSAAFDANFRWLFPAKHFKEYEDIFGDKPYQVENPYINHEMSESNDPSAVLLGKRMINAGIADFKYIIECNAYLPFTRTGSITINGDRVYKRGTWIKHEGTSELFYIDNVSHTMGVSETTEWTTTLSVSRGMHLKYLSKYFEIIDLPTTDKVIITPDSEFGQPGSFVNAPESSKDEDLIALMEKIMLRWNVNKETFEFFVKRRQHDKIRPDGVDDGRIRNTNIS